MKKQNFIRSLLVTTIAAASVSTIAATFQVSFTTIQDLQIQAINDVNFGSAYVTGNNGTTCTLSTAITAGSSASTGLVANSDIEDSLASGDGGCIALATATSNNLSGIYEITGVADQIIQVTVASGTGDFNFTPTGFMIPNDSTDDFSNQTTIGTSQSITIGDQGSIAVVVGGTITMTQDLTASTAYSVDFDITATY
jgi:hypothetical protein